MPFVLADIRGLLCVAGRQQQEQPELEPGHRGEAARARGLDPAGRGGHRVRAAAQVGVTAGWGGHRVRAAAQVGVTAGWSGS